MKFFRDERAQATIMMGLAIFCLCGMAGFAVDVGTMFRDKRILQTAADAAAIAGAQEWDYGDSSHVIAAAKADAARNGVTDGSNGYTVTVNPPPLSGPNAGKGGYVEVITTQSAPTYFMKLFHLTSMNVSARSVAGLGPGSGCIFTLDTSGVDVGLSGTGDLYMPDCGIYINSAASKALSLTGGSSIYATSIGIVGNYSDSSSNPHSLTPTPITGLAPAADPLSFEQAPTYLPSSCQPDPHPNSGGGTTLNPGCYNGLTVSGGGTVTLNPGVYIINGGFSSSGSAAIVGNGVTIYLAPPNGAVSLTGSGSLDLIAPTSGTYNGILFFQDPSDSNTFKIAGGSNSTIEGIFYAPAASLNLSGGSGSTIYADLVVYQLGISGGNSFNNYADVNANTPLTAARMVE